MGPHILHIFPSFATGGVQLRIVDVANRLGDAFTHTLLALDGQTDARTRLWPETPLKVETDPGWPSSLAALPTFRRYLRRYAPDLVCTYNWGSMNWAFAAATMPAPHLHFESGFSIDEAVAPLRRRTLFRRLALRRAAALVVPSETLYELARGNRWAPERRLRWIVNGVDVSYYRRDSAASAPSVPPPTVTAVAPLRREKRLDRLIAAACSVGEEVEIRLCGDGPERPALEAMARQSPEKLRVAFLGMLADIRPVLAKSAVFAITSQTEQMPNALLQAMAMELPVIAFDAGDIRRILPDPQRAFVFAQEDERGFRQGLSALLGDAGLRRRLGALNRKRVCEDYTMDRMVEAYRKLYEDTLAAGR